MVDTGWALATSATAVNVKAMTAATIGPLRRFSGPPRLRLLVKRWHAFGTLLICRVPTSYGVNLSVVTEDKPSGLPEGEPSVAAEGTLSVLAGPKPWYRRGSVIAGIVLIVAAAIAALVFTNGRADHSTSAFEAIPAKPPGQNETIKQYLKDNDLSLIHI